jgi:hypothetical protein
LFYWNRYERSSLSATNTRAQNQIDTQIHHKTTTDEPERKGKRAKVGKLTSAGDGY